MKLIINDTYRIECRDSVNYNLIEKGLTRKTAKDDGGKEKEQILGHYSNTYSALNAYVKKELDGCKHISEIVNHVDHVLEELKEVLKPKTHTEGDK